MGLLSRNILRRCALPLKTLASPWRLATTSQFRVRNASSGVNVPPPTADYGAMPEDLKRVIEEYERKQAEEEANQGRAARILNGRHGGVIGAMFAGLVVLGLSGLDDVTSESSTLWGSITRRKAPEDGRLFFMRAAGWGLLPRDYDKDDPYLVTEPLEGLKFMTPVGLASGFNQEATGISSFFDLGFGFIEVGPVGGTHGSDGATVWKNLNMRQIDKEVTQFGVVAVCAAGERNEVLGHISALGPKCQMFSVELSSEASLIKPSQLSKTSTTQLLREVVSAAQELPGGGPQVFLRISPSWLGQLASMQERLQALGELAEAALAGGIGGLIICHDDAASKGDTHNTEKSREVHRALLSEVFKQSKGQLVLIASGGIENGRHAMDAIEAGASVVQISSLLLTEGPPVCRRIKSEMSHILMQEGHNNLAALVGVAVNKKKTKKKNPWRKKVA